MSLFQYFQYCQILLIKQVNYLNKAPSQVTLHRFYTKLDVRTQMNLAKKYALTFYAFTSLGSQIKSGLNLCFEQKFMHW